MLTKKGKYGLKALIHLARLKPGHNVLGSEIARTNNIPKKFLDAILGELRREGLVHARKGPGGGYSLARDARKISMGEAIRVLDGPIAPIRCASRSAYEPCEDCTSVARCAVRLAMVEVRDAMASVLDGTSLEDLLKGKADTKRLPLNVSAADIVDAGRWTRSRRPPAA